MRTCLRPSILAILLALALVPATLARNSAQPPSAKADDASRTKDLSGVWSASPPKGASMAVLLKYYSQFGDGEPAMTPWAEALFQTAKPTFGPKSVLVGETNDPVYQCFPPGVPRIYLHPFPVQIVQTPKETDMLFEYDHNVRHIYTDGRTHPSDLVPSYMGHSIGHWEGDTLVVDTVGFNDKTWLDRIGHPHSEQLHVVERFSRPSQGELQVNLTIEDSKAYTKPITSTLFFQLKPDWEILEQVCMDNVNFDSFEKKEQGPSK